MPSGWCSTPRKSRVLERRFRIGAAGNAGNAGKPIDKRCRGIDRHLLIATRIVLAAAFAIGCKAPARDEPRDQPAAPHLPVPSGNASRDTLDLVNPGGFTATGDIDKDAIKRVVRDDHRNLQLCYERTLLEHPGLEGKLDVRFTIDIDGSVRGVTATGVHPDVERCITERFLKFKFPRPALGATVQVSYPFWFRPA